jgi:hypothetical protein
MYLPIKTVICEHGIPILLLYPIKKGLRVFKGLMKFFFLLACLCFIPVPALLGETLESIQAKITAAEEALLVSEISEGRVAAALENMKAAGEASPETIADYENYLKHIRSMVDENRKLVSELKAAYGEFDKDYGMDRKGSEEDYSKEVDQVSREVITGDEVCDLDRELDASLAAFDEMLLRELELLASKMDAIQAASSGKMTDLAGEAEEAAERLRDRGIEIDTSSQTQPEEEELSPKSRTASDDDGEPPSGSHVEYTGASGDQNKTRDRQDDDIVARQLREAAEKETDPELKEKLWKEYEEYRKGSAQERRP